MDASSSFSARCSRSRSARSTATTMACARCCARTPRLAALAGRAEWVVTVSRDRDAPVDDEDVRALDAQIAASPPGRAFLLDKQRGTTLSRSTERRDNEAAAAALAELEGVAERTYREPVAAE